MRPLSHRLGTATLMLLVALAPETSGAEAPAARTTRVYPVAHRAAEDLLPLAAGALGERGTAMVDRGGNAIVLSGDPGAVAIAATLLEQRDRRLRTVVVRAETLRQSGLESAGYVLDWGDARGRVRVGSLRLPGADASGPAAALLFRSRREVSFRAVLRIEEGKTGRIATGTAVPLITRGPFFSAAAMVEAESGFLARPLILATGRVRLELTPFQSRVDPRGSVEFFESQTTIEVEPGETVAIGGSARTGEREHRRVFSSARSRESRDDRILLLRVEVE